MKDINVAGNKMTSNGRKEAISKICIFFNRTDFMCKVMQKGLSTYFMNMNFLRTHFASEITCARVTKSVLKLSCTLTFGNHLVSPENITQALE